MPVISVSNQVPCRVCPEGPIDDPAQDFDPISGLGDVIAPITAGGARVTVDGSVLDRDGLASLVALTLGDAVDASAEDVVGEVLERSLASWDPAWHLPARRFLVTQAAAHLGLPAPDPRTAVYNAWDDVIMPAKAWLAKPLPDATDTFMVGVSAVYAPQTLGVCLRDDSELSGLKTELASIAASMPNPVSADVRHLVGEFSKLSFGSDLVIPLRLRVSSDDGNDPESFPRILMAAVRTWSQNMGGRLLAFDVGELVVPSSLVLVSMDAHAHADAAEVDQAWSDITQGLARHVTVLPQSQLSRVDTAVRQARKSAQQAAQAVAQAASPRYKTSHRPFRRTCPTQVDLSRSVLEIERRMSDVMRSQNAYKTRSHSFARQSRRDPDNPDRPGIGSQTRYHPDIHLYVDTSGSISEENYRDAVKASILLARKLGVNLWFTSFSDYMTTPALLHVKNASLRQAYAQVERLDKAAGGTDFRQIWDYVNSSAARSRELSLVITDFGYVAPNADVRHPKNLFYAPCSVSPSNWHYICEYAQDFVDSMRYIEPNVRARILM